MKRIVVLLAVLGLVAAACGNDDTAAPTTTAATTTTRATTTTTGPSPTLAPTCSAAQLAAEPVAEDLPEPVAAKRAAIVAAAVACDYDALAALAGDPFSYSFGDSGDPAGHWRGLEGSNDVQTPPMGTMVELLDMPYGTIDAGGVTYYVWPSAFAYDSWAAVPEVDQEPLRAIYGDADLASFARFGSYIGYRVGITADGTWSYFVAGD